MMLRLGGATHDVPINDLTLEVRPPPAIAAGQPDFLAGFVAVLDPWPMQGTAVLLGQQLSRTHQGTKREAQRALSALVAHACV